MTNKPRVFISHSSQDKAFVRLLVTELDSAGANVWFDETNLEPGDSLNEKIGRGLEDTDYFLLVLSVNSIRSKWVQAELSAAWFNSMSGAGVTIVPLRIDDCDVPTLLRDRVRLDLKSMKLDQVVRQLIRLFVLEERPAASPVADWEMRSVDSKTADRCPHADCRTMLGRLSLQDIRRVSHEAGLNRHGDIRELWRSVLGLRMESEAGQNLSVQEYWTELALRIGNDSTLLQKLIREICEERSATEVCRACRKRFGF